MTHSRLIQVIVALLGAGLIFGASRLTPSINTGRKALDMMGADLAVQNTPPQYAFWIQALGAFRGVITDVLFIRATDYKEKGRYHDAYTLAQLICDLQPRFPSVWEFQAWNMAWNISVTTYTPEERWNWVYNGVKLLRDRGLMYNPRAVNLYKQLAWIYVNKMSETVDEHHLTYKREWAWRMHLVFGPPPNPLGDYNPDEIFDAVSPTAEDPLLEAARIEKERRDRALAALNVPPPASQATDAASAAERSQATAEVTPFDIVLKANVERMERIAAAPDTLSALFAAHPPTRDMVAALRKLGVSIDDRSLSEETYWNRETGPAFTFFYRYRRLVDPPSLQAKLSKIPESDADRATREQFDQALGARAHNPDGEALVRFMQKKVLREVYKLDAAHMVELLTIFGPMDWRSVDAQALYWTSRGLIAGGETISRFGNDKTNTIRELFFALRNLRERNKMVFEPFPPAIHMSYFNTMPDLNFVEPIHRAYLTYGAMIDPDPGRGVGETFRAGHINFLRESIIFLYLADREVEAQKYYDYVRQTYGTSPTGELDRPYRKTLAQFVTDAFLENIEGGRDTARAIGAVLLSGYEDLADGNYNAYDRRVRKAREIYDAYMNEKTGDLSESKKLPPFADMQADMLGFWLAQPAGDHIHTLRKARLWKVSPINLKRVVYDDLIPGLTEECAAWEFDVALAFPEPPGMEEFRKQRGTQPQPERPGEDATTPVQVPG